MIKAKYKTIKLIGKARGKNRDGIAMIVSLIFMAAILSISFATANSVTREAESTKDAYKSSQAYYNAKIAAREAFHFYKHPEYAGDGLSYQEIKSGAEKIGQFRILAVSEDQGKLSSKINDWNVYPYPGSGTAGKTLDFGSGTKDCNVYEQIAGEENEVADKYKALLQKYGITNFSDFGLPVDFSCNWNKIKSFDSAVEIPLYAIAPDGTRVWLKFDEIKIRVRTACDETKFKEPNATTGQGASAKKSEEEILYDETGMCGKEERYGMWFDAKNPSKLTKEEYIKNTVLNWGIYSDKGDLNYLIPIKEQGKTPKETGDSNIHTKAINDANPFISSAEIDFVVLDGKTEGQTGFKMPPGKKSSITNVLNQPSDSDPTKPQINNPILRFTIEQKFKDAEYSSIDPKYIPYLEYQILYKINEASLPAGMDINTAQIAGKPVIIGEGYSGGFKHTVKLTIIETKTGFDYVYQKP